MACLRLLRLLDSGLIRVTYMQVRPNSYVAHRLVCILSMPRIYHNRTAQGYLGLRMFLRKAESLQGAPEF
jgi:hypothetical protein